MPSATAAVDPDERDRDLAVKAREGSRASFAELVASYHPRLVGFHRRRGTDSDAEDLTQETFLRAWRELQRYDERNRFTGWLFTIAYRLGVTHYRRRRAHERLLERLPSPEPTEPAPETHDDATNLWILARRVLTEDQQTALWLRVVEGLGVDEVASVIGRTRVTTRVMLHRARRRLLEAATAPDLRRRSDDAPALLIETMP